jgi:hypothetical protein
MNSEAFSLSLDEQRAAEAAFRGDPFDPGWSEAARAVYQGITRAQRALGAPGVCGEGPSLKEDSGAEEFREETLTESVFVDVSVVALTLGLLLPVAFSRRLWDEHIAVNNNSDHEQLTYIRDILVALRLYLDALPSPNPRLAFPALLAFPETAFPKVTALEAVIWGDAVNGWVMTIYLPEELRQIPLPHSL